MTRDMMPRFELYQPTDLATALKLAGRYKEDGWKIAGGQDSFDWFKDRIKQPKAVIDLGGIAAMKGIKETKDGLEIGALTTLDEVHTSDVVKQKYGLLSTAAGRVASPQIRRIGTIGGNVSQDARCWYYRSGLHCYRAGGNTCYSDTPEGMNREHTLFNASRCVAVSPSDTAPVMVVLEASMVIEGPKGQRVVPAAEYFIGPAIKITHMNVLEPDEILTHIRIPNTWAGANYYFEKVADRNTWDFPLVNIACAMKLDGDTITDIRVVCNAVECVPRRLHAVEDLAKGSKKNEETAKLAASVAARGASPLAHNGYKIPLMENLVKRAIRDA